MHLPSNLLNEHPNLPSDVEYCIEFDFGTVEPWNFNDPEILTRNCSQRRINKCIYKTPSVNTPSVNTLVNTLVNTPSVTDSISTSDGSHIFKSKPLPPIRPLRTSKSVKLKVQYEEPLGFTELKPMYNLKKTITRCNPRSYPRKLVSLPFETFYNSYEDNLVQN